MRSRTIDRLRFPEPLAWRAAILWCFVVNALFWAAFLLPLELLHGI